MLCVEEQRLSKKGGHVKIVQEAVAGLCQVGRAGGAFSAFL
jgi:hypothetical protein